MVQSGPIKSIEGQLQEIECLPAAGKIIEGLHLDEKAIKEVCEIIGCRHSRAEIDTVNFKIVWDADWLVNLPDVYDEKDSAKLVVDIISETFLTQTGAR